MWIDDATSLIKKHEGFSPSLYKDTKGLQTLGYGHCIERKPLTEGACEHILSDDVKDAAEDALSVYKDLYSLSDNRKIVLVNMAFNLGKVGLMGFKKMLFAINNGDFESAADEIKDSTLPEKRAGELADLMRLG